MHPTELSRFLAPEATPDEVRAAIRALPERSVGPVRRPEAFFHWTGRGPRPERDGPFCARLFGPLEDLRCSCGALAGDAHEGETCERCGVLCGASGLRDVRWAHVDVPGVVHPGSLPELSAALGWTRDEIRAVLANQADVDQDGLVLPDPPPPSDQKAAVDALLAALDGHDGLRPAGVQLLRSALQRRGVGAELLDLVPITAIPVPPPGQRRPIPPPGGRARAQRLGPVNDALVRLIVAANLWRRLIELDAPRIVLAHEAAATQAAFERYLRSFGGPADATPWTAPAGPVPLATPPAAPVPEECRAASVLWIDAERLLVTDGVRTEIVRATTGEPVAELPTTWWRPHSVQGGLVVCVLEPGCLWTCDDEALQELHREASDHPVALWDPAAGRWRERADGAGIRVVDSDEPEDLFVIDLASGARCRLRYGHDRPACIAVDRSGRYAWVGEGDNQAIVDLETVWPMLELGGVEPPEDDDLDDEEECGGPAALGLRGDDWHWLDDQGCLGRNEEPRLRIRGSWAAAAFDPEAVRIAIVDGAEVRVVRVDDGEVLARWSR